MMEKGNQWGNFIEINPIRDTLDEQIGASLILVQGMQAWFEKEEFKGLNLNDFKAELVYQGPNNFYPGGTVGLKITKKYGNER